LAAYLITHTHPLHDALPSWQVVALHVQQGHGDREGPEELRVAGEHDPHEQAAVGPAGRSELVAGRHARLDEGAGHGREVLERPRSEEHTSELQSRENLVCRL